jgi:protein-S-isoprenylcysteine O-methyltransferase Ste14
VLLAIGGLGVGLGVSALALRLDLPMAEPDGLAVTGLILFGVGLVLRLWSQPRKE